MFAKCPAACTVPAQFRFFHSLGRFRVGSPSFNPVAVGSDRTVQKGAGVLLFCANNYKGSYKDGKRKTARDNHKRDRRNQPV